MRKLKNVLRWIPCITIAFFTLIYPHISHATNHVIPGLAGLKNVNSAPQWMDIGAIAAVACRSLQVRLVDYFGRNISKYRIGGSTSFIKWLYSPQNTAGFKRIDVQSIPGKKRGVAFRVDLPFCFSLCALNVDCRTENIQYLDPTSGEMVFDLVNPPFRHCDSGGNPVKLRFKESDLEKYCTETDQSFIQDKISQYLLEWEMGLDKVLTTAISTKIGTDTAGNAITTTPIFVQGNNSVPGVAALNPASIWYMDQVFSDIGLEGQYALIGGTIVSKIADYKKWASANSTGVDLSKYDANNPIPFYDRNFNATFGQSDMIAMAPGTVQLVTWNKYKGEKARAVTNLYSKGTVVLPTTGLEVDWKWTYDFDCEEWIFEAFLYAELAVVPGGGCGTNDLTVNGLIRFHDCGDAPLVPVC
jgi:hypothetical protein